MCKWSAAYSGRTVNHVPGPDHYGSVFSLVRMYWTHYMRLLPDLTINVTSQLIRLPSHVRCTVTTPIAFLLTSTQYIHTPSYSHLPSQLSRPLATLTPCNSHLADRGARHHYGSRYP